MQWVELNGQESIKDVIDVFCRFRHSIMIFYVSCLAVLQSDCKPSAVVGRDSD